MLRVDELLDVGMPILERVHLRRAPRLAAGLHHVRDLIVNLEERKRTARFAAAAQFFARELRSDERSVPVPQPYLKSIASLIARRMMSSMVSSDRLDEAGAALRIFVLRRGALGLARLAIVEIIARACASPYPVLVIRARR